MRLLRLLPPETAHAIALWALRTGFFRVGVVIDAICTIVWAAPAAWLLRRLERLNSTK